MFHNAEHGSPWAMASQASLTPIACAASQVDLAHHPLADPLLRIGIGFNNFAHELMPGCAAKIVVAALKLQIGITDSTFKQTDQRESLRPAWMRLLPHLHHTIFQTNSEHNRGYFNHASRVGLLRAEVWRKFPDH